MAPRRSRAQRQPAPAPDLNQPRRRAVQTSRLFTLPPEVRDEIYQYLLPQTLDVIFVQATGKGRSKNHHISTRQALPISRVCKQVRREVSVRAVAQSVLQVTNLCFYAYDFNFSALQGYLAILAARNPVRLANFLHNGNALNTAHTLIVHLTISTAWCEEPNVASLTDWSRFVRGTVMATNTQEFAEYHFVEVEDKEIANDSLILLASGPQPDKEVLQISHALSRWYMFRGNRAREQWFMREIHRQDRQVKGEVDRPVPHSAVDEERPLWAPEFNEEESDDSDSDEESEAGDGSDGSEGGSEEDDEDDSDED
ncbi:hypothetical protein LTR17_001326 [Elasticomyces elasticus]|nr:hypothetical protein LTR17_001326 [Elasticomyces elasticus]